MEEDETVALSYGRQVIPAHGQFSEGRLLEQWFPTTSNPRQRDPFCNNANSAIRRAIWRDLPFDEDLTGLEDLDWARRVLEQGNVLAYCAEAPIVHVHDEVFSQIVNRYRREAIAHKAIYDDQEMSALHATRLALQNVVLDGLAARRQGRLSTEARGIVRFRLGQFYGAYRGFRQHGPVSRTAAPALLLPAEVRDRPGVRRAGRPGQHHQLRRAAQRGPRVSAFIDISMPLRPGMVAWPGSPNVEAPLFLRMADGDPANATRLSLDVHCGTHVDAPLHQIDGAASMASMALEDLCGPAVVVEIGDARRIGPAELAAAVPDETVRVLLKTSNSRGGVAADAFDEQYAALTADGAQWLVDRGVRLVGIDYLSIQRYDDDADDAPDPAPGTCHHPRRAGARPRRAGAV